ncbi:MAG: response regulator [Schwartzia sp.]|nr:response regulator [Schwartzia sp. (in: firmicutes)]
MEKKVMMIRNGMSFVVNALEKKLEEAGYSVVSVDATVEAVNAGRKGIDIFLLYLGDFVSNASELLVFLKDLCTEEEKLLLLLGNPMEIATVEEIIPPALIVASFERPLNIEKLIGELDHLAYVTDEKARKKSILLVDDDNAFLKTIREWLSEKYRVTIVMSGAQALMYMADNTPDLILLDYEMPVTSGPQVLEMIRSEQKVDSVPVIFLTGKGDRESVMKVLALKPDGYLLKSVDKAALLKALEEFFEKRKYEQLHEMQK